MSMEKCCEPAEIAEFRREIGEVLDILFNDLKLVRS